MSFKSTEALGSKPIPKLLIQQAVPASIGILVMSLNILIDTIFVGQWMVQMDSSYQMWCFHYHFLLQP